MPTWTGGVWSCASPRVQTEVLHRLAAGGVLAALGSDHVDDRVEDGVLAG